MNKFKEYIAEQIEEYLIENSDLNSAMADLVDQIKNDGYEKGMEDEIADDWDIKVQLLVRMFEKKYGKKPQDFKISDNTGKIVAAAKKAAKEYRNDFSGTYDKYVGKIFERPDRKGKQYVFVAWTGKDIHVITIPDQKERRITFRNARSGEAFMKKHIL